MTIAPITRPAFASASSFTVPSSAILRQLDLLRGLSVDEVTRLALTGQPLVLPRGRCLFQQGQAGERVYLIVRGSIKIVAELSDAPPMTRAILGAGELFGASSLADSERYAVSAFTQERVALLAINGAAFRESLRTTPALRFNLSQSLARRQRITMAQSLLAAGAGPGRRIALLLLTLAAEYGRPAERGCLIPLRVTQRDLADLAGVTPRQAGGVLSAFQQRGWVTVGWRGYLVVRAPAALTLVGT